MNPETEFKRELESFSNEIEEAIQCFYGEQAIQNIARNDAVVYGALIHNAAFWNLACRALHANTIVVLGRIFDTDSRAHTLNRLLELATRSPGIFSKNALETRKLRDAGEHTAEFMRTAYIPRNRDFERLQSHADRQRAIYRKHYRVLRDKVFAHKERADLAAAFASASTSQLGRLLVFLDQLERALWQLFVNGRKPVLRPARYSARRILKSPLPKGLHRRQDAQEWITREVEKFLRHVSDSYE